jgi:hypothetical protein
MKKVSILSALLVLVMMLTSLTQAEDGELFRRNVSKTPLGETEKAAVYMMDFYVPAQSSAGIVGPVENYCVDDGVVGAPSDTCVVAEDYGSRNYAKPLVSVYIDGIAWEEFTEEDEFGEAQGGITFGQFDAFVGISLDDGTSWRTEDLSRSADLSSFTLANGHDYPGDVHAVVHQVAEDKILVVWASKYCQSGFPLYSWDPADADTAAYLADLEDTYGKNALYLYDLFGVGGAQGSVNYTEQGFPEIGEIPYSCIWTARGKLLPGDDPMTTDVAEASHVVWTAPERLTSGVRDANLPAVDCAGGAGCALTWQEDPEGLRPGQGLGPGEGWSGAIANAKTDIWYSYITFADFDLVQSDTDSDSNGVGDAVLIEDYELAVGSAMDRPKPYVPMAMPVRLTDNDMCRATSATEDPYCWIDFDSIDDLDHSTIESFLVNLTGPEAGADFCASTSWWDRPDPQTDIEICVTEDGRWMMGRVASTRVRMALKPYTPAEAVDLDGDGVVEKSAWLSLAAEETKALGLTADLDGDGVVDEVDPIDIGKNMFYYSFDYAKPYNLHVNTSLDAVDDSAYVVQQGGMLNQPASCSPWFIPTDYTHPDIVCEPYEIFEPQVDPITGYEYYLTEISRRFALTLNSISNITNTEINTSGLAGMLIYKQGIINQGGPADIMLRRLAVPDDFDPASDNPFAYENMECVNPDDGSSGWVYPVDDNGVANPNYLQGLCMAPAINISGSTIAECTVGTDNDTCAAAFPVADDGSIPDELKEEQFPKVLEWRQLPYEGTSDSDSFTADLDESTDLDDQSWENPYDIAKGHRGFLYGDYVMMMYAWSPNWQSNAVGNDHYNLYQRRSFDGGLTWKTTPSDWCSPVDNLCGAGLDALEYYYGETIGDFEPALWHYEAGVLEQARNLSLLHGNKVTILDPRYSPPGGLKQYATIRTDWLTANADLLPSFDDVLPYPDDLAIDPSKYYMVYETGDNTTVAEGEAVPLDLFYSRATVFGDVYEWFDYVNDLNDGTFDEDGNLVMSVDIEPRWPWLENAADDLSGEAGVVLNPGGTFAYNVWNQWREEILPDGHELVYDSDMIFRRLLWLPDGSTQVYKPVATLLYQSTDRLSIADDDVLVLVGSGRDIDHVGQGADIINYMWFDDNGAIYCKIDDIDEETGEPIYECEKDTEVRASDMEPGKYHFHFKVQDNELDWSREVTSVEVWVAMDFYDVFLPMTIR